MADEQNKQEVRDDMNALREDLTKLQNDLQGMAQSLMDRGRKQAMDAKQRMNTQMESSMETLEQYIEQRPMTTLLSAFGVGLIIGTLFSRK